MLNTIFQGIFDSGTVTVIPVKEFLICIGVALLIGIFLAAVYTYKSHYTKSFVLTLAMLPAVVCVVIMMATEPWTMPERQRLPEEPLWQRE